MTKVEERPPQIATSQPNLAKRLCEQMMLLRKSAPLWLGMTAISGYNLSRMSVLSNSGRVGAAAGLLTGAFFTFRTLTM